MIAGVDIRRYRDADVPRIGAVHAASRHAAYAGLVAPEALAQVTPQTQTQVWSRRLTDQPGPWSLFVVEHSDDRRVDGFVQSSGSGTVATLNAIHVLPGLLGSGAGQLLHDHIVAEFRAWRSSTAQLWMLEGNARAQAFTPATVALSGSSRVVAVRSVRTAPPHRVGRCHAPRIRCGSAGRTPGARSELLSRLSRPDRRGPGR